MTATLSTLQSTQQNKGFADKPRQAVRPLPSVTVPFVPPVKYAAGSLVLLLLDKDARKDGGEGPAQFGVVKDDGLRMALPLANREVAVPSVHDSCCQAVYVCRVSNRVTRRCVLSAALRCQGQRGSHCSRVADRFCKPAPHPSYFDISDTADIDVSLKSGEKDVQKSSKTPKPGDGDGPKAGGKKGDKGGVEKDGDADADGGAKAEKGVRRRVMPADWWDDFLSSFEKEPAWRALIGGWEQKLMRDVQALPDVFRRTSATCDTAWTLSGVGNPDAAAASAKLKQEVAAVLKDMEGNLALRSLAKNAGSTALKKVKDYDDLFTGHASLMQEIERVTNMHQKEPAQARKDELANDLKNLKANVGKLRFREAELRSEVQRSMRKILFNVDGVATASLRTSGALGLRRYAAGQCLTVRMSTKGGWRDAEVVSGSSAPSIDGKGKAIVGAAHVLNWPHSKKESGKPFTLTPWNHGMSYGRSLENACILMLSVSPVQPSDTTLLVL